MVSSKIVCLTDGIPSEDFAILPPTEMAKRETIGERLKRAREELGLSAVQLREKILEEYRFEVGASTILATEDDKAPNAGRKTIEFMAKGVNLDPLEVFALGLDDPPELDPGYSESFVARMYRLYKKVRKEHRPVADDWVRTMLEKLERWG